MFQSERGTLAKKEEATRVSLVPDTKLLLKGASLKPTDKKSKTTKPKKPKGKSNFDKDTSDEEEMDTTEDLNITGSVSGEESDNEEEETTGGQGDEMTEGLLTGDRTGCPVSIQQAATARISSEAEHILNNTLTKQQQELALEGKQVTQEVNTADLIPETFLDPGLETLRKELNESNRERQPPNSTIGVEIQTPGTSSAFKPPTQDKGKYNISTGIIDLPDPGNRQAPKPKTKIKPKPEIETNQVRRSKRIPKAKPTEKFGAVKYF